MKSMKIGGTNYEVVVEDNDLGVTFKENGKTLFWLNSIGTAALKTWLSDFDPDGRMQDHQSVRDILAKAG